MGQNERKKQGTVNDNEEGEMREEEKKGKSIKERRGFVGRIVGKLKKEQR